MYANKSRILSSRKNSSFYPNFVNSWIHEKLASVDKYLKVKSLRRDIWLWSALRQTILFDSKRYKTSLELKFGSIWVSDFSQLLRFFSPLKHIRKFYLGTFWGPWGEENLNYINYVISRSEAKPSLHKYYWNSLQWIITSLVLAHLRGEYWNKSVNLCQSF